MGRAPLAIAQATHTPILCRIEILSSDDCLCDLVSIFQQLSSNEPNRQTVNITFVVSNQVQLGNAVAVAEHLEPAHIQYLNLDTLHRTRYPPQLQRHTLRL